MFAKGLGKRVSIEDVLVSLNRHPNSRILVIWTPRTQKGTPTFWETYWFLVGNKENIIFDSITPMYSTVSLLIKESPICGIRE